MSQDRAFNTSSSSAGTFIEGCETPNTAEAHTYDEQATLVHALEALSLAEPSTQQYRRIVLKDNATANTPPPPYTSGQKWSSRLTPSLENRHHANGHEQKGVNVKHYGLDIFYTLADCKSPQFEIMSFGFVEERVISASCPYEIMQYEYVSFPIRSLLVDVSYGHLL
uniref:Uncharacterized protein n=1 Tax=Glossina morsitans morsitans TaxID=37546 RepID=A0A1B0FE79_GLOMM